jgi:MOSC domain-containing protein YiiM
MRDDIPATRPSAAAPPARVREVLTGKAEVLVRPGVISAIAKHPVHQPVRLGTLGLDGDEQADRSVHGGPAKAVHLYAWQHYAAWQRELPDRRVLDQAGAFGENLSLAGLDEAGVCIADRWRVGSAELEVSQGRQPCWKLNLRFDVADMSARVQNSLRAGWYCRVAQPGWVQAGDAMDLVARPHPGWSIARLLRLITDRECNPELLEQVLGLPLTPSWRKLFLRRLEAGRPEDWTARLQR